MIVLERCVSVCKIPQWLPLAKGKKAASRDKKNCQLDSMRIFVPICFFCSMPSRRTGMRSTLSRFVTSRHGRSRLSSVSIRRLCEVCRQRYAFNFSPLFSPSIRHEEEVELSNMVGGCF